MADREGNRDGAEDRLVGRCVKRTGTALQRGLKRKAVMASAPIFIILEGGIVPLLAPACPPSSDLKRLTFKVRIDHDERLAKDRYDS